MVIHWKKRIYLLPKNQKNNMNVIGLQTFVAREVQRFLRVFIQTLISPWINAILYIFIFGFVVGSRIDEIAGVPYIMFVLPGVLMLNLISSSFSQTSSSLYFQRFAKHIEEILVAPLSNLEMVLGYVSAGILRSLIVGVGIYVIALLFGAASVVHIGWFLFYVIAVALVFSLLGLIVALWADSFEQLTILNTFIITPLTFFGGMFNSIDMLPENIQTLVRFNPFFYFVSGLRYAMTGIQETNIVVGVFIVSSLAIILGATVWRLFAIGWRIRN